jgi:hypothetical protein
MVATDAAGAKPRTWPITATLVVVAFLLFPFQLLVAGGEVSRLFGDIPSRDRYISAGMRCLTTVPVFAAMIWCGWQRGPRRGLWVIGAPAALMALSGLKLLATTGDPGDPHPSRTPGLVDLFGESTRLSWGAFVVLVGCAVTTYLLRRRTGPAENGSAP